MSSRWVRLLAAGSTLLVLAGCGAAQGDATTTVPADYYADEYGVRVGVSVSFPQDLVVTGARLLWDDQVDEVPLYPLDGTDPDRPPDTVSLEAGAEVLLEGQVVAACPEAPAQPVFEVEVRRGGRVETERLVPGDPTSFADAFEVWCGLPVVVHVTGSQHWPDGRFEVHLQISNPGPAPVAVASSRVERRDTTWNPSSVVAPAGALTSMRIEGHSLLSCSVTPPWESGDLVVDGVVTEVTGADGWC